ncbi:MAG: SoxR reducing system RseC family protein [Spirochaetaceae bacterium]|jgi:positive regulator of sigma E activity|nr:SoxR reducing system RseC family protein [Spirochaetaceae bacterium]
MREKAMVVRIDTEGVWVKAVEIEACINCENSGCRKEGNPFFCLNPKQLPLSAGSYVRVAAPVRGRLFEGFRAILFPLAAAAAGYFLASAVLPLTAGGEGWKAGTALLFLLLSAVLVFCLSSSGRSSARSGRIPEVTEILSVTQKSAGMDNFGG